MMVILGLGTNLGDRAARLQTAVDGIRPFFSKLRCSPVYECPALLPPGAPKDWDMTFYNMAVMGESMLTPRELLAAIQALEGQIGRVRRGFWSPREIDIDILAYGEEQHNTPQLVIPHPALPQRDFAVVPFADLAPDWRHPVAGELQGKTARELAAALPSALTRTEIVVA